eukprot:9894055-Lingulodinium_polyedra.AAC.1
MGYIDFTVYMTTKRMKTPAETDKMWLAYVANPNVQKDREGMDANGNPDVRAEVNKGGYRMEHESLSYAKFLQCELDRKRKLTE